MATSDMVKELCLKMDISISELSRRIDQTPQNFNKKLKRNTVSVEELIEISNVLDIAFEKSFTLPNGGKFKIENI